MLWRGERLTYGEGNALVRTVATQLRRIDEENGGDGRVAVYSANCPAAIIVWLAAQAAGLTPVTLNRHHRGNVLRNVVERAGASVLVTDSAGADELGSLGLTKTHRPVVLSRELCGLGVLLDGGTAPPAEAVRPAPQDPATIMFSSGTTGSSKGVIIPHGMFDAGSRRLAEAWNVTSEDVFHCWVPWYHIAAQQDVFALALRAGAGIALFEGISISKFWEQIRESEATIFGGFVTVLEMLHAQPAQVDERNHRLRFGIAGHIPAKLQGLFEARFGVPMLDAYGMSEAEPLTIPSLTPRPPRGSVGKANPDFEIAVQRDDGGRCVAGEEGQIVFRPLSEHVMMREYLDDPQRTAASWKNGWFRTGDLGAMDAGGNLFYRDRIGELIRVGGENVSPQELESVLMAHPCIAEAAVLGVAAPLGEHQVVALVVANAPLDELTVQQWCAERAAKFMVPSSVLFVDRIPRTPTSKVQRTSLQALLKDLAQN